jgi:hypothetical protein
MHQRDLFVLQDESFRLLGLCKPCWARDDDKENQLVEKRGFRLYGTPPVSIIQYVTVLHITSQVFATKLQLQETVRLSFVLHWFHVALYVTADSKQRYFFGDSVVNTFMRPFHVTGSFHVWPAKLLNTGASHFQLVISPVLSQSSGS